MVTIGDVLLFIHLLGLLIASIFFILDSWMKLGPWYPPSPQNEMEDTLKT